MGRSTSPRRSKSRVVLDGSWFVHAQMLIRATVSSVAVFVVAFAVPARLVGGNQPARIVLGIGIVIVLGSAAMFVAVGRPVMVAERQQRRSTEAREAAQAAATRAHEFAAGLQDAFDMAETEADAVALVARAFPLVYDGPAELLLADSSRAHLSRVAVAPGGAPGCSVPNPWQCPAMRRGHAMYFPSSASLSACPRLAERGPGLAALCTPVVILGTPMGVLHLTKPVDAPEARDDRVLIESIAVQAGARIGALRATASSQAAAATDPLTGLLNRRSMADAIQLLAIEGSAYAVVFADLDSFKALNDTFGHATGDHALRLFARTLTSTLREHEIICRYGGEEFLIVLPTCGVDEAAPVVHRLRESLKAATAGAGSGTPTFTASFGLADSTYADDPLDVIALADQALLQAKREGKDRLIIADRPAASPVAPLG